MKLQTSLKNEICVHENSLAHLKFTAYWQDETGVHSAIQHVEKFNVWRDLDLLPAKLIDDILHQPVGKGERHRFSAGELVPAWQASQQVKLPLQNFVGRLRGGALIKPLAGRYYPAGMVRGVAGIYSENMFPTRIVEQAENEMVVDYNHPLALNSIELEVEILDIMPPNDEHGGRCADVINDLLNTGPGMQAPTHIAATDFFVDGAFSRVDESCDRNFYQQERMVHHLDAHARKTIAEVYGKLIKPGSRVLDLMSSWESHLPDGLDGISLSGLGMNAAELKNNPALDDYVVHDLNEQTCMPYRDESFDAVICSASVEYLTQPLAVFAEVRRVLKPGGACIITFSNRWFPAKAIQLWSELHEFERAGLVVEYFRQSGWTGDINTFSSRGRHRPLDDPHYIKTHISDPVYAVWCRK